jgi:hypothetical protein
MNLTKNYGSNRTIKISERVRLDTVVFHLWSQNFSRIGSVNDFTAKEAPTHTFPQILSTGTDKKHYLKHALKSLTAIARKITARKRATSGE